MPKLPTARDVANAYALLGVPATAGLDEVKTAYRDLAKVWHPDRFDADARLRHRAAEKLKQINAAYQIILAAAEGGVQPVTRKAPAQKARLWPVFLVSLVIGVVAFVMTLHFGWKTIKRIQREAPPAIVASEPASLPAGEIPWRPMRDLRPLRGLTLLELYPSLMKSATPHLGQLTCGSGYLFNAEEKNGETLMQVWLSRGKRVWYEKNTFLQLRGTAPKCVQDIRVELCGHVLANRTYRTRQGESQTVPHISVDSIVCQKALYLSEGS